MDADTLRDACRTSLDAADTLGESSPEPPRGEWNADQIPAHVCLVSAATIEAASRVAAGANTTYDSRRALDPWSIARVLALARGRAGLRERLRCQGEALCALVVPALSEV